MSFDFLKSIGSLKADEMGVILSSYGVTYDNIDVVVGESVDNYRVRLSLGCRSSKINRVLPEIGMRLRSYSEPMGTPISSDGVYNIAIQTKSIESASIRDMIVHTLKSEFMTCPIAIGVDSSSNSMVSDLSKMPNLLIGGVPGSGKSMLLHSIVLSCIVSGADMYLCDPKLVEFSKYKDNKSVKSIAYDVNDFRISCSTIIKMMNDRYAKISSQGCTSFTEYNDSISGGFFKPKKMRPVVLVVDEWADIYLDDKTIESLVCSIAQKGRAAGIFVILATQRPSTKVVSGLIKASFPARIALRTSTAIDSRVILEESGAEKMSDPGSGLYRDSYTLYPKLFRAPFVDNESIDFILKGDFGDIKSRYS